MTDAVTLVVIALASYRLWRVIGRDEWPPSEWFRERIYERAENEGGSVWHYVQTMVRCPWCLGFFITGAVVAWAAPWETIGELGLWWLATSCAVGLIGERLDG